MKKTLFLAAALCLTVAQAATYTFEATKSYGGDYPLTEDSTFNVVGAGTVATLEKALPTGDANETHSGALIKDGEGTLQAKLNVTPGKNPYTGSVSVNQGTLELLPIDVDTYIGAGEGSSITVNKGALLIFGAHTGVNIPSGNTTAYASQTVNLHSVSGNTLPSYNDGVSSMSNVVLQQGSLVAQDTTGGARGTVYAYSTSLTTANNGEGITVANTDLKSNEVTVNGHSVIDNSTIVACNTLYLSSLKGVDNSIVVQNGSRVLLDNETNNPENADAHVGVLMNTSVDKTSYVNAGDKNGQLTEAMKSMTPEEKKVNYFQLYAGNKLAIASEENGGVAVRQNRVTEATEPGKKDSLEVVYVTDQLSGCQIGTASELKVTLEDTVLSNPEDYDSFTFTVVLKGLDSHDVLAAAAKGKEIVSGQFYTMGANSPVWLELPDNYDTTKFEYNSAVTIASFTNYVDEEGTEQGPATVFRFLANRTPEPATATLSLLALAGLAARRRRH